MNQPAQNKKGDGNKLSQKKPTVFRSGDYYCIHHSIMDKIIRLLKNDKLSGERSDSVLAEIEK